MSDTDLYEELAELHGHYCPMSTLGLRLGLEAMQRLSSAEKWELSYLARTCAVDGIRLAMRHRGIQDTLPVEQQGQHLLCCRTADGKELSLGLSEEALLLAKEYQQLDDNGKNRQLELLRTLPAARMIDVTGSDNV